jgi:hypothetical protein
MCLFLVLNVFGNGKDTHFPLSGCSPTTIQFDFINIYHWGMAPWWTHTWMSIIMWTTGCILIICSSKWVVRTPYNIHKIDGCRRELLLSQSDCLNIHWPFKKIEISNISLASHVNQEIFALQHIWMWCLGFSNIGFTYLEYLKFGGT